ncbi:unnamed protein product, partial [Ilex paraguariensis]
SEIMGSSDDGATDMERDNKAVAGTVVAEESIEDGAPWALLKEEEAEREGGGLSSGLGGHVAFTAGGRRQARRGRWFGPFGSAVCCLGLRSEQQRADWEQGWACRNGDY